MEFECRTCLKVSSNVHNIFSNGLPLKIETISSVEISEDDRFSSKICEECVANVTRMYEFRQVIQSSNVILMNRCMKAEEAITTQNEELEIKEEDISDYCEMENDDDDAEIEAPTTESENIEIFKCVRCDFASPDYDLWEAHEKNHRKKKQADCKICGKSVIKYNLKRHHLIHTESPVNCEICGVVCKHEESLRAHMSTKHNHGPYQCTICGKVYRYRQGYYMHKKLHTSGNSKMVECSTCGKLFFDKKSLVNHIYSHTGERPFACRYCDRGFSNSDTRNTHESSVCIHFYFDSTN